MSIHMDSVIDFPQWLIKERSDRGWSQSDLARTADISRQVVSDYEGYKRKYFDEEILVKIARAFELPPEMVFRVAGLLPAKPNIDEETEELNHLIDQLPADKKSIARSILKALLEGPPQVPAPAAKRSTAKGKA